VTSRPPRKRARGKRSPPEEASNLPNLLAIGAALAAGLGFVAILVVLLSGGGTDEAAPPQQPTAQQPAADEPSPAATATTEPVEGADAEAIEALARRSIEVLPAGAWPALYDSFTTDFRDRCPQDQFAQAGADAATDLGDDLQLLRYLRLEGLVVEGETAEATIIGDLQGEYRIEAHFRVEDGDWKIAPAADTAGCEAFGRVEG
jgi:hypothetical protein